MTLYAVKVPRPRRWLSLSRSAWKKTFRLSPYSLDRKPEKGSSQNPAMLEPEGRAWEIQDQN